MKASDSATVTCSQQANKFSLNQLQQIRVSGITFVSCAMDLHYVASATLERNVFENRNGGTSILSTLYSSVLQIRFCIFLDNTVPNIYGIIYNNQNISIKIEQTTFKHNSGRAIYMQEGNLDVLNSNFSSNNCSASRSRAISVNGVEAKVTITNTFFDDNRAENGYNHGGAVYVNGGKVAVTNSTFINNSASNGGGGAISTSFYANISLIKFNNVFSHNSAAYCGAIEIFEFYHNQVN